MAGGLLLMLAAVGRGLRDEVEAVSQEKKNSQRRNLDFGTRHSSVSRTAQRVTFTGKLVGRYYDSRGNPTKYLKGVEAKAARGAQLLEKQKKEEAKQPSCNSRWSQESGGEVWCDVGVPRLVQRPLEIALTGKMSKRCACFKEDELGQAGLEVYDGCDFLAKTCRV
ncbi:Neuferricin [Morella rubra]|uniref:Neuferricin n=1 Tax=Morella rubra TaxID=262757 RepID=A0A6A1W437_9ROSI|nr:Neuferricin [Morella rubra]